MRKLATLIFSFMVLTSYAGMIKKNYRMVKKSQVEWLAPKQSGWCSECGMNLQMFYRTGHAIKMKDETYKQFCSLHCLVDALENRHLQGDIMVVDNSSLKFIPAQRAFYVVGSNKPATMSKISKYAFAKKESAKKFMQQFGGKLMSFSQVYTMAKKSFSKEIKVIARKKKMMVAPKGKKVLQRICPHFHKTAIGSVLDVKEKLKQQCVKLNEKQLQMAAIYLMQQSNQELKVPVDAKCPVCGMFVAKYPKWVASLKMREKFLYFDGVKDLMKYYLGHGGSELFAQDYYSLDKINLMQAYFVMGSDVFGPMGRELIPFSSKPKAIQFKQEHHGKTVLTFKQITNKVVKQLDE